MNHSSIFVNVFLLSVSLIIPPSSVAEKPTHEGKTLAKWVELIHASPPSHHAMYVLGEMGEPAIPPLIEAMRSHPDGAIRWLSHVALAEVGRAALPELDRVLVDGDYGARIQAVLAIEKILGREAIPRLTEALKDPDAGVRTRAHGALLRAGEPKEVHLPPMIEVLRKGHTGHQWIAAEALGHCGPAAAGAEKALAEALEGPASNVSERALRALKEIATEEAMDHVWKVFARKFKAKDLTVQDKIQAIAEIGDGGPPAREALPTLLDTVDDLSQDILVRGYAAWAVGKISPRADDEPGMVYHVAQQHPRACDENPGTRKFPWKTVQMAAESMHPGDTVLIHDGIYREFVRPFRGGISSDKPITYEAARGQRPVIKGSDIWKPEWKEEEASIWSAPYERHPWDDPENWPEPQEAPGPVHRAEQIFVDDEAMVHVATMEELRSRENTFLTDDDEGIWLHLASEMPPCERLVERSMRQQVFAPAVRGLGHIHVRGLTMLHSAAPESTNLNWNIIAHRSVMSVRSGHHWVIENNTIEWGNAQGLDIGGEGWGNDVTWQPIVDDEAGHHILRGNHVNYHGVAGIVGWAGRTQHLLLEDNETNFNCQKGDFYQYESAGVKIHNAQDCVILRHSSHGNNAFGIWLDHNCERNRVSQCILTDNMGAGFFFEVSAGPILVDNNVITGTRDAPKGNWADGIYSHDGNHATYVHNYIADCEGFGVRIRNIFTRIANGKPTTTCHNRIQGNFLVNNQRGAISLNPEVPRAEDNQSDDNCLWQSGDPIMMRLENSGAGVQWEETPIGQALEASGGGDLMIPLEKWQNVLGQDQKSVVQSQRKIFGRKNAKGIRSVLTKSWAQEDAGAEGRRH